MVKVLNQVITDEYALYHGDCVDVMAGIPDNSIGYSIYSPPFQSLYVFSNSERDMSNNADPDEFWRHYKFLIGEHMRTMMPGRLVSVHCVNLPTTLNRDGQIGLHDFRGDIIRAFIEMGFIYHSEVVIWKNPVVAMQRTKAIGLLHKQIKKDSSMSRMGIPDYLVTFRKPGDNEQPIAGRLKVSEYAGENAPAKVNDSYSDENGNRIMRTDDDIADWESIEVWQRYASPVWMDIDQGKVMNYRDGAHSDDEKHITPLQLQVIERGLQLWSNPGDTVLTPFLGIGSEAYTAVKMNRKTIGIELKESYFDLACRNVQSAIDERKQLDIFACL